MGTYSMVLSKAAFFRRKYLDLYASQMPTSIHDYVTTERNCEDIAMSLLVANTTSAPPIWVKGKIYEIGSSEISSLKGYNDKRNKCLKDSISLYGTMPLVSTNLKAVDARSQWFW
ncbi:PREDICTED: glycosyltransferase family 64 protein C4-like [Ipomoea nil]|uniref:glycosyltransferase family 64 protein C4-like n=1 Tax=Ipomoea nil TaxID=35883 RepID=UPI0009009245|nr:PREDICTED: glycosyltransferase family 64 protein C4-like [Ipomoea nil]XP_019149650.1 PREDICTED: glycosyltransferase family 64 protein C4-like [Ipomoea nil]